MHESTSREYSVIGRKQKTNKEPFVAVVQLPRSLAIESHICFLLNHIYGLAYVLDAERFDSFLTIY